MHHYLTHSPFHKLVVGCLLKTQAFLRVVKAKDKINTRVRSKAARLWWLSSGNRKEWAKQIKSGRNGDQGSEIYLVIFASCDPAATDSGTRQQRDLSPNWCHDTLWLCLYSNELFSTVYFASIFHKSSSTLVIMQNSDPFLRAGVSLGGSSWAFQPVPSFLQGP